MQGVASVLMGQGRFGGGELAKLPQQSEVARAKPGNNSANPLGPVLGSSL